MSTYESHPSPIGAQRILNNNRDGYTIQVTLTNLAVRDLVKALARRVFTADCNGKPLQIGTRLLYLGGARTRVPADWSATVTQVQVGLR